MLKPDVWNAVVLVTITVLGLMTAYISFGVLKSSADGEIQGFTVGGAIAGAVVTWLVLGGIYTGLRKSSTNLSKIVRQSEEVMQDVVRRSEAETAELRRQNIELQRKVMRGMDLPTEWAPEAIDRQRIVLARPNDWVAVGGTIFQLAAPESERQINGKTFVDVLPATFQLNHYTIPDNQRANNPEETYEAIIDFAKEQENEEFIRKVSTERIRLGAGGDPNSGVISLKIMTTEALLVSLTREPVLKYVTRQTGQISAIECEYFCAYLDYLRDREADENLKEFDPADTVHEEEEHEVEEDEAGIEDEFVFTPENIALIEERITTYGKPRLVSPLQDEHERFSEGRLEEVQIPMLIRKMRVLCVNQEIGKVFEFEFVDDDVDFDQQTASFNAILDSVRFLPEAL